MARTLGKAIDAVQLRDPSLAARYNAFYEGSRGKITLDMLGTGSWRRAIEILDQYHRTGYVLERYRPVIDMFEAWESFG